MNEQTPATPYPLNKRLLALVFLLIRPTSEDFIRMMCKEVQTSRVFGIDLLADRLAPRVILVALLTKKNI